MLLQNRQISGKWLAHDYQKLFHIWHVSLIDGYIKTYKDLLIQYYLLLQAYFRIWYNLGCSGPASHYHDYYIVSRILKLQFATGNLAEHPRTYSNQTPFFISSFHSHLSSDQNPCDIPLYRLVNMDPYNGLLQCVYLKLGSIINP